MSTAPALETFAALRGERFDVQGDGMAAVSAELVDVQALPAAPIQGRQPFTLLFAGPPEPRLPQRIYRLAHAQLPAQDVFLVPIGADAAGVRYEAVFN